MWLIARRSFAEGWVRLTATLLAALLSVGLIAGSLQFALRAQAAVAGSDASEYARADVVVQGGTTDPDDLYALPDGRVRPDRVAGRPGVEAVHGDAMVPATVASPGGKPIIPTAGGRTLLRPWVADAKLNPFKLESGRAPRMDGEVVVIRHVARAGKVGTGSRLRMTLPRTTREVTVVGVATVSGRSAVAAGDLVLAPPETVRLAAGLPAGTWQSVWVKAASGVRAAGLRDALARDLRSELGPEAVTVRTASSIRTAQSNEVSGTGTAIGGVIGMMSSVAVFVGLFVVANTFGTLVRQRTRRLALLGAIGATPRQIKRLIRFEALVLGLVASAGGVVLGFPIAALLASLFAKDGFDISAADAQFGWVALAVPAVAGVAVTQLAAWRAARRAARISPMQALRSSAKDEAGRSWPRVLGALAVFASAWGLFGPAFAVARFEPPGPERTVAVSMLVLMGSMVTVAALAVLAPFFVGPLGGLVGRVGMLASGEAGRLARATITRSPRRVSSAASSLMLGVALVAATAMVLLSSGARFAEAGREVLPAEHAVASSGKTADGRAPLPADVAGRVAAVPGVAKAVALTQTEVKLVSPKPSAPDEGLVPTYLMITGAEQDGLPQVLALGGRPRALRTGQIALTSNVLKAHKIKVGERIVVRGSQGKVTLTVADAYHDPSHLFADQGLVSAPTMRRLDATAATQAVLVRGGSKEALARAVSGVPGAEVVDRDRFVAMTADSMTKGLKVTYGFIGMALVLALFGMATTVSMSVGERTREFGLLGAVGATMSQVRAIIRWEAATVVLIGTLLGLGAATGTVTTLRLATGSSFVGPAVPWWMFALVIVGAAAVTLGTSALPARRAARVPVLEAAKAE
ncbi:FtsX-like permease family protein [Spirillospora sp. CA-294931]|uniref:FtsX-like permease family protein n=1 Tax=Spirillospora sp. CA-294931 TaxID=3240042 RepID=UPI003D8D20A4